MPKLNEYLVTPRTPGVLPQEVKASGPDAVRAWQVADTRDTLIIFASTIKAQVAPAHKIKFVHDGSGYGVKDHKHQYCSFLLLRTTEDGAAAIAALEGLHISANQPDVHALPSSAPAATAG